MAGNPDEAVGVVPSCKAYARYPRIAIGIVAFGIFGSSGLVIMTYEEDLGKNLTLRYRAETGVPQPTSLPHTRDYGDLQFVHIPKTGGTYVQNWAAGQTPPRFYGSKRPQLARPWKNITELKTCSVHLRKRCCSWWHLPPRMFADFDPSSRLFTVIRDPIARMLSELKYREKAGSSKLTNKSASEKIRKRVKLGLREPTTYDCHYFQQYLYVTDANDQLLQNMDILCTETLDQDLRERFPGSVFPEVESNPSKPSRALVLEPDVEDLLKTVYRRDFELHAQFCGGAGRGSL